MCNPLWSLRRALHPPHPERGPQHPHSGLVRGPDTPRGPWAGSAGCSPGWALLRLAWERFPHRQMPVLSPGCQVPTAPCSPKPWRLPAVGAGGSEARGSPTETEVWSLLGGEGAGGTPLLPSSGILRGRLPEGAAAGRLCHSFGHGCPKFRVLAQKPPIDP